MFAGFFQLWTNSVDCSSLFWLWFEQSLRMFVGNKSKERISKRVFQENKARQISYVCVSEGKKCCFFAKFGVLCFLEKSVLRFALLPYYRRVIIWFLLLALKGNSRLGNSSISRGVQKNIHKKGENKEYWLGLTKKYLV